MAEVEQSAEASQASMREALAALGLAARTAEPSKISLSSLLFFDGSDARQGLQPPSRKRRLRSRGRYGSKAALGAAASAAALVLLIALCAAAYFHAAPLQLTRRRLSEGGAPEPSAGLAACGETSGDAGDDVQGPLREEELGPPQAKKAKLEDSGHESDHEKGSQPQASTTRQEEAASDLVSAAATASDARSPPKPHISPEEVMAAEALIFLSGAPAPTPAEGDALLPDPAFQGQAQLPSAPQQHAPPSAAPEQQAPPSPATYQQAQSSPALQHQTQSVLAFQQEGQPAPGLQQQAHLGSGLQQQMQTVHGLRPQLHPVSAFEQHAQLVPAPQHQAHLRPAIQEQVQRVPSLQQRAQHPFDPQQQAVAVPPLALVSTPRFLAVATVTVPVLVSAVSVVSMTPAQLEGPQPHPAPVQGEAPCPGALPEVPSQQPQPAPIQRETPLPGASPEMPLQQPEPAPVQRGTPLPDASPEMPSQQPEPAPVQREKPLPGAAPQMPSQPPEAERRALLLSLGGLEVIDPLEDWEPPPPEKANGRLVVEHAFSRLPQAPGGDLSAYNSFFSPQRAISHGGSPKVTVRWIQQISALLAQPTLSPRDMRVLADAAERVLSHLHCNETRQPSDWPGRASEVLGYRFLLLDMLISILEVLGVPRSGRWWDNMISRVPHENHRPSPKRDEQLPAFSFNLATRLTAALQTLKTGHRPEPKLLIHLKRCLFCCRFSPVRFLRPAWNSWREADKLFYQQFEGTRGQTPSEQPGPSHQGAS
ncbi:hypothetical protein ACSSS7_000394 [Eimeria intestinalis]